jgi:hypothetical protein
MDHVFEAANFSEIAAAILRVRWPAGAIMSPVLDVQ